MKMKLFPRNKSGGMNAEQKPEQIQSSVSCVFIIDICSELNDMKCVVLTPRMERNGEENQ